MSDVIKLETPNEDVFSDILNVLCEQALNGNKKEQDFLEKHIFFEKWNTIQSKLETEGSTWYVWWMDGVRTLMQMNKKGTT